MSLEMVYVVDRAEFSMPVRDHEMFLRLGKGYPRECESVFGVDEPDALSLDEPKAVISRAELLASVEALLTAFKQAPELNPRRYVFDFEIIPGVPVAGDEEVNAVKLPGKEGRYHLLGGVGQCVLRKIEGVPGGFPIYTEPVDVRDQTVIETENKGPIKIRSTKKRSPIAGDLKRLSEFLKSKSGENVTKRLL